MCRHYVVSTMPGPTPEALRLLFKEAKDVLAAQLEALANMDSKAEAVARFNLLIVGFIVTVLTVLTGPDRSVLVRIPVGVLLSVGFAALVLSSILAVRAYVKKDIAVGLHASDVQNSLDYDIGESDILSQAIRVYTRSAASNDLLIVRESRWLAWALGALVVGIISLATGAAALLLLGVH